MKIITTSDTHNLHNFIPQEWLESADCIIYAGDMTSRGTLSEVSEFLRWFSKLSYKYKILIAGNHDWAFEKNPFVCNEMIENLNKDLTNPIIYLNDSGVEIEGIKIWGSPIQPYFHNWAFNRTSVTIQKHWDLIPLDTDILVTHGPVENILDRTLWQNANVGCPYLKNVIENTKIKLHICGHIHEAYGKEVQNGVTFLNASAVDYNYQIVNKPHIFEFIK